MIYTLQAVKGYEPSGVAEHWPADHPLGAIRVSEAHLLGKSSSIEYRVDAFQPRASVANVGHLALELDAANAHQWIPEAGWLQSDRDHRLIVSTAGGLPLWSGYATGYKLQRTGSVKWEFESHWQALDDITIAADPLRAEGITDLPQSRVPAEEIMAEVRRQLTIWPTPDTSGWLRVYRPEEDEIARDYVGRMLLGQRVAALPDASGGLEIVPIQARSTTPVLTLRYRDLLNLQVLDGRRWQWNSVRYTPHPSERERLYQGSPARFTAPSTLIRRYGVQELRLDLSHLGVQDARNVADAWQRARMRPRERVRVRIGVPEAQVLGLHLIRLELDAVNDVPIPLYGLFIVVGARLNIADDTMDLTLERWLGDDAVADDAYPVAPSMIPEPPRGVVLHAVNRGLVVSWNASETAGVPVGSYQIRWRAASQQRWSAIMDTGSNLQHHLDGLANGIEYVVQIRAVSSAGNSEWSDSVDGEPEAEANDPPAGVLLTPASTTEIDAAWEAPITGDVVGYEIRWSDGTSTDWPGQASVSGTGYPIDRLTPGTRYWVEVRALLSGDTAESPWSATVSATTLEA